jgi:hypothetical protein
MPVPAAFMKKGRKAAEGSAAEEKSESPMMEKGEGPEYGDAPHGKKPCAKCAKKGKKKGSCSCDKGGKMDAALTPMEYLDACDLGIQDRSKSYIRARLDATATAGKGQGTKCGNGYIGRGKKCRSGAGGMASSTPSAGTGNKMQARAGKALNIAAGIGGAATTVQSIRHAFKGNFGKARAYGYAGNALGVLQGQGKIMEGKATGNTELQNRGEFQRSFSTAYGLTRAALSGDLKRVGKAAVTGYQRAQAKKPKMRNMSAEEYSAAARAAGNPEGPSRRWSQRKGSVNTTARAVPAGLLRGSSGPAPDRKTTAAERNFTNARAAAWRKRAGGK